MTDIARNALLSVEDVRVHFGGVKALDGATYDIAEGSLCGIIGPNGSGKTTMINAISGLVRLTSGDVRVAGQSTSQLTPPQIARSGVRRTFQAIRLLPELSVLNNVMLGADNGERVLDSLFRPWRARKDNRRARDAARDALAKVGLESIADEYPGALPYGHQRRVEIARALASRPQLLLLDEPVAGMNSHEKTEVAELLVALREEGLTQMLVEHDLGMVTRICDYAVVMNFGRIIATGDPATVTSDERVREAYLGRERAGAAISDRAEGDVRPADRPTKT